MLDWSSRRIVPRNLNGYIEKSRKDTDECFLIIEKEGPNMAGAINISQIFYGGFKNAYLGYYLFTDSTGRGLMAEALNLALGFAFRDLGLHRLEANIQPENLSSIKLVKRCGFTKEGYSRKYLKVGGRWRGSREMGDYQGRFLCE